MVFKKYCAAIAFGLTMFASVGVVIAIPVSAAPVECVPVGVTTKVDGSVWAVENCGGGIISYRIG